MPDLKEILGEHFSEELAKAISTAYGKETVSKEDFNKRGATIKGHEETIKTLTEQLDSLKSASPDINALREQLKESEARNERQKLENIAWREAMKAGAKNPDTILLLAAKFLEEAKLADDGTIDGYDGFLKQLSEAEDTASLFKKEGGSSVHINGAQPSEPGNTMDPNGSSDFEARLAAAKESGDLAQISYIKRTAAEKGIILN